MMPAFEYASPSTVAEALKLLDAGAVPLAGGTDLLSLLKDRLIAAKRVVDVKGIAALRGIAGSAAAGLEIGAAATLDEIAAHPEVRKGYAALVHAIDGIRSPQIRSRGTAAGDLCQRPRCWYYRNGFGLLGTKDGKSLVPAGDNRYHAILGNAGPAYFVNPSSLAPALCAFGASLVIAGPAGERTVAAERFFRTPANDSEREIALSGVDLLTRIVLPSTVGRSSATYEVRAHDSLDWPLAAAAVLLDRDGATVRTARIVMGHVAPVPWRAPEAERLLAGKTLDEASARAAGQAAVASAKPLSMNAYKVRLASVAVARALLRAAGKGV